MAAPPAPSEPPSRSRLWRCAALGALLLLGAAVLLVAVGTRVRPLVEARLTSALGVPVSLGLLWWNPWRAELIVERLAVGEGGQVATVRRLRAQVPLRPLLERRVPLQALEVTGLQLALELDDQLRARVVGLPPGSGAGAAAGAPAELALARLTLRDARIELRPARESAFPPLELLVDELAARDLQRRERTGLWSGAATLRGALAGVALEAEGELHWEGQTRRVQARAVFENADLAREELPLPAPLRRVAGRADGVLTYALDSQADREVIGLEARIEGLELSTHNGVELEAPSATIQRASAEPRRRRLGLGIVRLAAPALEVALDAAAAAPPPGAGSAAASGRRASAQPWALELSELTLDGGRLRLHRGGAALALAIEQGSWRGVRARQTGDARLRLRGADGGSAALLGRAGLQPLRADLEVELSDAPLPELAVLLPAGATPLRFSRGRASARLQLRHDPSKSELSGSVRLDGAHTAPPASDAREVLAVHELEAQLSAALAPQPRLAISQLRLSYPYAMLRRAPQGLFPLDQLAAPEPSGEEPKQPSQPALRVEKLQVEHGRFDFVDDQVEPHYWTGLAEVSLQATRLPPAAEPGSFALQGLHDELSPIEVSGEHRGDVLSAAVEVSNFFISTLNPYVAPLLGYQATQGLLSLRALVRVRGAQLDADSELRLTDPRLLQTGLDTVAQQTGVPLPIALSLLADLGGTIELKVPFSGNLERGRFELGSVGDNVFTRAMQGALKAPLRALGSLFGTRGAPHAFAVDPVPFPARSAELDAAGQARIAQLARILATRPLLLVIAMPQVAPEEIVALGETEAARLAEQRTRTVQEGLTRDPNGGGLEAKRIITVPWKTEINAQATQRSGVYIELQHGS
jgi:uncharacterized protein involved in outer membrane biogenesis